MQTKAAQLVVHRALADLLGLPTRKRRQMLAQVRVAEV